MSIPANGFRGVVRFKTWFGKYIAPSRTGFLGFGRFRPDYSNSPHDWDLYPSRHGGYHIRTHWSPGGFASASHYFWQTDMNDSDRGKLALNTGADDWETYFIESHPRGNYALRGYANGSRFVCAEPEDHGIHLIANRDQALEWEQFQIEIVREGLPDDPKPKPPTPVVAAFICTNCGMEISRCQGGVPGQRCLYCSSPAGHCKCPHCEAEFYEIYHTH